jgi:hypothetical protein
MRPHVFLSAPGPVSTPTLRVRLRGAREYVPFAELVRDQLPGLAGKVATANSINIL